jgi:RNA polymerase sigma-70 factor (ECF subfamily)
MERNLVLLPGSEAAARPPAGRPPELERALLERAQRGDEVACRALVVRYQQPVFATLARVLGRGQRLELVPDLAQETFLRVFRELPAFRPEAPGRLSSWILTIAARLALDELKRRRLDLLAPEDAVERLVDPAGSGQDAEQAETAVVLDRALATLGPGLRAVLLLRVVEELPYEEIARALAIEIGTVKSRLARARAALGQALAAAGETP